ncbi:MAG: sirohydrochlorin cobaltochelatase [Synergistaceae bacterium]|jgi:sirohydrochlorin cobaltochelatase|nr:sirohydrochlorin cobaltochelatase [Synergistaceae bacterium]
MKYLNCALLILAAVVFAAGAACAFPIGSSVENPKKGILVVAFGSSMPEGEASIEAVADAVRKAYPDVETRVSYTSRIIMRKIARENGKIVDEPAVALAKMAYEGFTDVAVLSTHIIPGEEYDDLKAVVDGFKAMSANAPKAGFRFIELSSPLLSGAADFERLAGVLADTYSEQTKKGAFVFVGHGTHHFANAAYGTLQFALWEKSPNFYVGTIEGLPSYDDVASRLKTAKVKNVWIAPAMLVAGDHAHNDIAGEEPDSWKSMLEAQGYKVTPVLEGLGQNAAVRTLILDKLREAWGGFKP